MGTGQGGDDAGRPADAVRPGGPDLRSETSRLLAFSDGVFAIVITLLVLDLQPPDVGRGRMLHALVEQWPAYLAYLTSYLYVAVSWLNHRTTFHRVAGSSRGLQWWNLAVLSSTALLPFATSVVSTTMQHGDRSDQRAAVAVYGLVGVLLSGAWLGLYHYLGRHHDLLHPAVPTGMYPAERLRALVGVVAYVLAGLLGFLVAPPIALIVYLALPVFYASTSEGLYGLRRRVRGSG
ncbi:TMEM175 family protein [Micromonospora sp. NPDC051925]|uniref:TMEM175 family protein n=1 Tax=Micromonospora sp. NPDC051925 TaxID=3364288 RepID=UPI0037C5844B